MRMSIGGDGISTVSQGESPLMRHRLLPPSLQVAVTLTSALQLRVALVRWQLVYLSRFLCSVVWAIYMIEDNHFHIGESDDVKSCWFGLLGY